MEFVKSKSPQAHTEVIEQICDAILRGELRKGDRLPSEREIAAQTGISRTSVREALGILTQKGMLEATPGWRGGTRLANTAMSADLLGERIDDDPQLLREFYEARNILESTAAQLAAVRSTPEQIEELEQCVLEMEALVNGNPRDYDNYFPIDNQFHRLVMKGAGNSVLFDLYIPIMRKLWLLKDAVDVREFHTYGLRSMKEYLAAIKARDPRAANDAMLAHVGPLLDIMREAHEESAEGSKETVK